MPAATPARDAEALGYRVRGWTYDRIAESLRNTMTGGTRTRNGRGWTTPARLYRRQLFVPMHHEMPVAKPGGRYVRYIRTCACSDLPCCQ